jgi:hypothetical protein
MAAMHTQEGKFTLLKKLAPLLVLFTPLFFPEVRVKLGLPAQEYPKPKPEPRPEPRPPEPRPEPSPKPASSNQPTAREALQTTLEDIQLAMQRTDIAKSAEFEDSPPSRQVIDQTINFHTEMIRTGKPTPTVFLKSWIIESVDDQTARVRVVLDDSRFVPAPPRRLEVTGYWLFFKRPGGWKYRDGGLISERRVPFEAKGPDIP